MPEPTEDRKARLLKECLDLGYKIEDLQWHEPTGLPPQPKPEYVSIVEDYERLEEDGTFTPETYELSDEQRLRLWQACEDMRLGMWTITGEAVFRKLWDGYSYEEKEEYRRLEEEESKWRKSKEEDEGDL